MKKQIKLLILLIGLAIFSHDKVNAMAVAGSASTAIGRIMTPQVAAMELDGAVSLCVARDYGHATDLVSDDPSGPSQIVEDDQAEEKEAADTLIRWPMEKQGIRKIFTKCLQEDGTKKLLVVFFTRDSK
jgi:hypothetical protein